MRPSILRIAIAATLLLPSQARTQLSGGTPFADQAVAGQDPATLAAAAEKHARQRDGLLGLLALALAAGFALHWNGTRRIRRLESVSLSDPLTGVRNRRYLEQTIGLDVASSIRTHRAAQKAKVSPVNADLVFMMIDLDNFKAINDQRGHDVGDLTLQRVANALQETCRDSDLLVRWGGDEFLVIERFTSRADAAIGAERFRRAVEAAVSRVPDAHQPPVTCSVGYAAFPFRLDEPEALSWEQVATLADLAVYSAKRDGRNACAGYVWNGLPRTLPADLASLNDPRMLLRLSAVRREISSPRDPASDDPPPLADVDPDASHSPRRTLPRIRLNP